MSKLWPSTFFWALSIARADPSMLDRDAVFHADPAHQSLEAIGAEDAQQIVLERQVKARGAGVALASGTTAQLVVDAARFMAFGAENMQSTSGEHLFALAGALLLELGERLGEFWIVRIASAGFRRRHELGISAEHDIGAAARHIGRNRHRAVAPRLGDDFGLALVILGVEHEMLDAGLLELFRHPLGLFDRNRADQHRLSALVAILDFLDHRVELLVLGLVDDVVIVDADHRLVGRNDHHVEPVDFAELDRLGVGGSGHPGELLYMRK